MEPSLAKSASSSILTGKMILAEGGPILGHGLLISGGHIEAVLREKDFPSDVPVKNFKEGIIVPGLIDLQINGGGGIFFTENPSLDALSAIGAAHIKTGTVGFLPTLVSDTFEKIAQTIQVVDDAIRRGFTNILGVHIEGPFFHKKYRGAHSPQYLQRGTLSLAKEFPLLKYGPTLITLAPEEMEPGAIRTLIKRGAIVFGGHSNATTQETQVALDEGLSGFTHVFNAMRPISSREPGILGTALTDKNSWATIIVDKHHLHPLNHKIALTLKDRSKLILISDAIATIGSDARNFLYQGRKVSLDAKDRAVNEDGTIAGAHITLGESLTHVVKNLNLPLKDAVHMASTAPAKALGLSKSFGQITPGARASFLILNQQLAPLAVYHDGIQQ